ncbi:hypothetical protein Pfo_031169 [Paulownia fortunei]|nr:hypothetical protein Pfo_031169 [Paulownia fortunei]
MVFLRNPQYINLPPPRDNDVMEWAIKHLPLKEIHVYVEFEINVQTHRQSGGENNCDNSDGGESDGVDSDGSESDGGRVSCDESNGGSVSGDENDGGRPAKARRRELDELLGQQKKTRGKKLIKLKRQQTTVKCRNYAKQVLSFTKFSVIVHCVGDLRRFIGVKKGIQNPRVATRHALGSSSHTPTPPPLIPTIKLPSQHSGPEDMHADEVENLGDDGILTGGQNSASV